MNPGVYESMTGPEYFAASDWVSSSKLKHHLPEYFRPSTGARDALDFGTALHTKVLGTGDEIAPINASTWQGKDAKERREAAYTTGMVPILEKDLVRLDAMELALRRHREASEHLFTPQGTPEVSVFTDVEGVPCKARFDRLNDSCVAVDLKTTAAMPSEYAIVRAVLDYGYDIQADHYLRVASAAGLDVDRFVFVFVGKEAPHHVTVVELDHTFYERAAVLRDLALNRFLHPEMVEAYPGAEKPLMVGCPKWARLEP